MPKPKQLAWTQLRVGLLVLVSLAIFATLIFLMTGEGFFQRKYTLRVLTDNAGGLKTGDPVRLAGIDVGNVVEIHISPLHDPQRAVEVVMRVRRKYQEEIRADSVATLAAEGLLGQRFLNITRGSPGQPVVPEGGVVKMRETPEISDVVATSADVMVNLNRITGRVDRIMAQVESGKGSLGKIIYDESLYQKANRSVDDAQRLISYAAAGKGSFGKFLMEDDLYNTARGTLGKADQIVDDVRSGRGSLGKFVYDAALYNETHQAVSRVNNVMAGVEKGQGSLGKLVKDESFYNRLNSAVGTFDKIGGRLERGEGSAGRLLQDPALYNNMNSFTQELRTLIADFRQNPKKFLTIHFRVF